MVKSRMSTADVAAEVAALRRLIGMRVANVYDLNPKTYIVKLARSSGTTASGETEKELLLLESGVRFHTTRFTRDKSIIPSGFTLKLRKHVRTRRLENVRQLGVDRVVDFQFGSGEGEYHIILELYASGNIILTDGDYLALTLLRTHRDDDNSIAIVPNHVYPVDKCRLWERTSAEKLKAMLAVELGSNAVETPGEAAAAGGREDQDKDDHGRGDRAASRKAKETGDKKGRPDSRGNTVKNLLAMEMGYGPSLCEHIILDAGIEPTLRVSKDSSLSEDDSVRLLSSIVKFEDWLEGLRLQGGESQLPLGYILMQKMKAKGGALHPVRGTINPEQGSDLEKPTKHYDEFSPLLLKQYESREVDEYPSFDVALDEFFSKIEGQKIEQQRVASEQSALSKLDKVRADQTNRVEALKKQVDNSIQKAELITYNLAEVDLAISAVRAALASGMDWADLTRMIKEERRAGNPVANLIHSLQLHENKITLLLANNLDDMDDDERTRPAEKVQVDLELSAHAISRAWFDLKRRHALKQEKTEAAHDKAFKAAQRKTQQQLSQAKTTAAIAGIRKTHWFEKFHWFISSENYLVISGRDAQQNELVVKRYLRKGDIYVHADLHGAASTIIKNHDPSLAVPPLTVNQAGIFTVCRSAAWDSKIVTSAWWVHPHQVSKTAPTGEYLTVGSFVIRGRKNFLPPNPLVMGFGFLFRVDESSVAAHLNERRVRGEVEGESLSREAGDVKEHVADGVKRHRHEQGGACLEEDDDANGDVHAKGADDKGSTHSAEAGLEGGGDVDDLVRTFKAHGVVGQGEAVAIVDTDDSEDDSDLDTGTEVEQGRQGADLEWDKQDNQIEVRQGAPEATVEQELLAGTADKDLESLLDRAMSTSLSGSRADKYGITPGPADAGQEEGRGNDGDEVGVDEENALQASSNARVRGYVSKAQRRKMKSGGGDPEAAGGRNDNGAHQVSASTLQEEDDAVQVLQDGANGVMHKSEGRRDEAKEGVADASDETAEPATGVSQAAGYLRGKRGKLKKIKDKYAEQDEEERQLRMQLLASAGKKERDKDTAQTSQGSKRGSEQSRMEAGQGVDRQAQVICYKCKQAGHIARDCPSGVAATDVAADNAAFSLAQPNDDQPLHKSSLHSEDVRDGQQGSSEPGQLSRRARARQAEREVATILAEEHVLELAEEEKEKLTELDSLTGCPTADDIVLYAVPVCGPYSALQAFKYRVKLTPGSAKKGKAAKTAVDLFTRMAETTPREKECLKAVTEPELVAAMIGNVKITAPGLTKVKQGQKERRKASSKAVAV